MTFELKNPFVAPKQLNTEDEAFVRDTLGEEAAREMASLLGAHKLDPQTEEDWDGPEDLRLSQDEKEQIEKERVFREVVREMMMREEQALKKFFGKDILVPPLPSELTLETLKRCELLGFEPHYLPSEDLADILRDANGEIHDVQAKKLPGWKSWPDHWFFGHIQSGNLSSDAAQLPGCWILIDARRKPSYNKDGEHMYDNDPFAPVLEMLRTSGIIEDYRIRGSRFHLSPEELEKPEVITAFAEVLSVSPEQVSLPDAMEFNILGNIHYPQWGKPKTMEWLRNPYDAGSERLVAGGSSNGGLSGVMADLYTSRSKEFGFRLIVRFPS